MQANFSGPSYTLGIEEELMILDSRSLNLSNSIEAILEEYDGSGDVKPELMESVLEIAVGPHRDTREAGAALPALRRDVADAAGRRGLRIGSAGTPPTP